MSAKEDIEWFCHSEKYVSLKEENKCKAIAVANTINSMSENYQLSHSVFACDRYLNEVINGDLPKEIPDGIRKELLEAVKNKDAKKVVELDAKIHELETTISKSNVHIVISYIESLDPTASRVVKNESFFEICLPSGLRDKVLQNGEYDKEIIKEIRGMVAHELGHLVLQYNVIVKLAEEDVTVGTKSQKEFGGLRELEANFFKDIFLSLRRERNQLYLHI